MGGLLTASVVYFTWKTRQGEYNTQGCVLYKSWIKTQRIFFWEMPELVGSPAVCGSVRLLPRPSGRTRQIRSGCSARSESRPPPAQSAPGHSRRCSCSARRRSLKSRPARASSGKKKSSAALPAGSRNERKSTGANSPGAFFAAAHAFLYSPVISRCFFLGRAWRTRR